MADRNNGQQFSKFNALYYKGSFLTLVGPGVGDDLEPPQTTVY